eukprot:6188777-Pleurochrysis_carterae.AAC.1
MPRCCSASASAAPPMPPPAMAIGSDEAAISLNCSASNLLRALSLPLSSELGSSPTPLHAVHGRDCGVVRSPFERFFEKKRDPSPLQRQHALKLTVGLQAMAAPIPADKWQGAATRPTSGCAMSLSLGALVSGCDTRQSMQALARRLGCLVSRAHPPSIA